MGVVTTTRLSLPEVEQLDQQQPNLVSLRQSQTLVGICSDPFAAVGL
jgi:hypothetical protein